jgi:hypothetical protein
VAAHLDDLPVLDRDQLAAGDIQTPAAPLRGCMLHGNDMPIADGHVEQVRPERVA